jgi:tRNA(Arg) A34 adenosine deaminase TadA
MNGDYKLKIEREVKRFKKSTFSEMESETTQKRVSWFKENYQSTKVIPSPQRAYELFLLEYLGLSEKEVPVTLDTKSEIEWLSYNRCLTLETCKKLKLDTRIICRRIYEKSTQAFMSQINPQLRFLRNYQEIRPYSPHCKEMIIRLDFEQMIGLAIEEAKKSKRSGNKGYGAVVVIGKEIFGIAHDTAITRKDPSRHAEFNAIRQAVAKFGDANLCGGVLFSTCEPCPMCSSLAVWANLTTIVYGASIEDTAKYGRSRIRISTNEIVAKSPVMIEVIGNVLKKECEALYV